MNLVTGATGLLGNNIVRQLLAHGERVRVLVRPLSDPRPLDGLNVEVIEGDLTVPRSLPPAVRGVARVFHAAALVQIGRRGWTEVRAVNELGSAALARAANVEGARFVHVSSVDVFGWGTLDDPADEATPPSEGHDVPYVATKRLAEEAVLAEVRQGLDAVVVNPAFLLGPWDWKPSSGRMLVHVARGRGKIAPPGGNDFCHVVDVAEGALAAAEHGRIGERYILGGESLTYRQAWTTFAEIAGVRPPWATAPAWLTRLAGGLGDAWTVVSGNEPDVNSTSAHLSTLPHHFSGERAHRELGYRSRSAGEAAADALRWFRDHGYV